MAQTYGILYQEAVRLSSFKKFVYVTCVYFCIIAFFICMYACMQGFTENHAVFTLSEPPVEISQLQLQPGIYFAFKLGNPV